LQHFGQSDKLVESIQTGTIRALGADYWCVRKVTLLFSVRGGSQMKTSNNRLGRTVHYSTVALIGLFVWDAALQGQPARIAGQITNKERVALVGNVNPKGQPQFEAGPVEPSMKLSYMTLMLKPSGSQQAALEQLLAEQQDRRSPNYHKWLTPEQYADRFALSPTDIGKIRSWLEAQGFSIDHVARSRNWLAFSGTAAQVKTAFQTEIHYYLVDGEKHFANATEPMIPAALESLVIGLFGLDDFHPKASRLRARGWVAYANQLSATPRYTNSDGSHALVPGDIATIYDITPLYDKGFDGTGQKLVVVGSTDINLNDIQVFRGTWNLPANNPQVVLYGPDPGTNADALGEADLDIEWSGAVARNATIIYVYSQTAFYAVQYAIEQNLAPVISMSVDACEPALSTTTLATGRILAWQANVQGITWLTASGDAGAAACDLGEPLATHGFAVYHPADIPEVTAVGGTEFNEGSGTYWSSANSPTGGSALSYIPETAWNDSVLVQAPAASGGGFSAFFTQPAWQMGLGLPTGANRAVPDVSLTASAQHDAYSVYSAGQGQLVGGTSAATPVFAGIIALLNQYEGSNGQGNINPNLYQLAQSTKDIFHDITTGSNIVPCQIGTPDCTTGSFGYNAGPGYNVVTGLGSVDAYHLVTEWNDAKPDSNIVPFCTPDTVYEEQPDAQGNSWFFTISLTETASVGTRVTGFTFNGTDYSSKIVSFFGTSAIPGHGTISAKLEATVTPPTDVIFGFSGVDSGGRQWSQHLVVPFDGPQPAQTPAITAVVNAASFAGGGIVPGEIASLFGVNLTTSNGINLTSSLPLPTKFLNDAVTINGSPVPLFAVDNVNGQQQFNFQVPWEVAGSSTALVTVSNNGTTSGTIIMPVLAAQPGIIAYNVGGNTFGVILHANYQLADTGHPAQAGETVLIYCTGLGLVNSPPADGAAGNGQTTLLTPTVTMGGKNAAVSFSGLAPGFVGLYQINTVVPSGLASGNQPVAITMGGSSSNSALLPNQ
jgi:uncharacterized protein (TIGR03437 family)